MAGKIGSQDCLQRISLNRKKGKNSECTSEEWRFYSADPRAKSMKAQCDWTINDWRQPSEISKEIKILGSEFRQFASLQGWSLKGKGSEKPIVPEEKPLVRTIPDWRHETQCPYYEGRELPFHLFFHYEGIRGNAVPANIRMCWSQG